MTKTMPRPSDRTRRSLIGMLDDSNNIELDVSGIGNSFDNQPYAGRAEEILEGLGYIVLRGNFQLKNRKLSYKIVYEGRVN